MRTVEEEPVDLVQAPKSKSQRKREVAALQALGEELVGLRAEVLARLPLQETLLEAVCEAQRIRSREALRRQLQFIGRLMRESDAEAIEESLALERARGQAEAARDHRAERWRTRLVEGGGEAVEELLAIYPGADRQRLRQLVRDALSETRGRRSVRATRALFRYLRGLVTVDP